MKIRHGTIFKGPNLVRSLLICVGVLIGSLPLQAQSGKGSTAGQITRSVFDNTRDPLSGLSASLQLLSKRVSPGVLQIFT
jgi:hypothetical protein